MAEKQMQLSLGFLAIFAISACNSIDPVYLNDSGSVITQMELRASESAIAKGYDTTLSVIGTFEDGSNVEITDRVEWISSNPDVLAVESRGRSATARGLAEGGAVLTAKLVPDNPDTPATWTAEIAVVVGPPVCTAIEIAPVAFEIKLGETRQLTATGTFSDGSSRDVTAEVTWTSEDASLFAVDQAGLVSAIGKGSTGISATMGVASASVQGTAVCGYPGQSTSISNGGIFPQLKWAGAFTPDGQIEMFDLEEFHCSAKYQNYKTVNFIVGTEWCPNCPGYMQRLEGVASELEAAGGLLVYVEIQNQNRSPSDSQDANRIVNKYIQSAVGWRLGDTDSSPRSRVFGAAITSIPDAFVVRKSDMKVIGHQRASRTYLDFVDMAAAPDAY